MKVDEIKFRVKSFLLNTIDLYLPPTNFFDKIKNTTAKFWVEQNSWKLNKILDAFSDENHEIDTEKLVSQYENVLFDQNGEMSVDVKSMIPSEYDTIKSILPDKIILFKKEDLRKLFQESPRL